MIVKKDGFEFYADKNKNPDILLYAPNNQNKIYEYIIHNKIKKIALCGGGEPTQKYLDTIIDFEWLEYINGIGKKLDYRFINKLPNLKTYIGTLDFELSSKSVEEVYVDYNASGRILSDCSNLKILTIYKLKSFKIFADNKFPENLTNLSIVQGNFSEFPSDMENTKNIEALEFSLCSKLKTLNGLEKLEELKSIHLDSCKNLIDVSILPKVKNLEEFVIVNMPNIANSDIVNDLLKRGLEIRKVP